MNCPKCKGQMIQLPKMSFGEPPTIQCRKCGYEKTLRFMYDDK